MTPGDLLVEEDCERLEFSPKRGYAKTMEVAARTMAAMQGDG
jgi:hypothetical protein